MDKLQRVADRQWVSVYACGTALGVWLIAFVLVLRFGRDLGLTTSVLVGVSLTMMISFSLLFVGEGLKAQAASKAVSAERERASRVVTE